MFCSILIAIVCCILGLFAFKKYNKWKGGEPSLLVKDWKPDTVYLVQFPRAGCIPSPSPFVLKLETWLRMAGIKYENVNSEFKSWSQKGQIPFIEHKGKQMADSNFALQYLIKEFGKENLGTLGLEASELALWTACSRLLEQSLFWGLVYHRSRNLDWFATRDKGFLGAINDFDKRFFPFVVKFYLKKKSGTPLLIVSFYMTTSVFRQGYGRHTVQEIYEIMCQDLDALSTILGEKEYFFKEYPTTFDAVAFGHLTQFLFTPMINEHVHDHMKDKCQNLVAFCDRMKDRYWPDWEECTKNLTMNIPKEFQY